MLGAELADAPGGREGLLLAAGAGVEVADATEEGGLDHPGPVVECAGAVSLAVTSRE